MPPARLGLVYSHTGLRKFLDAIGAARTRELFLTARNVDARRRADGGGWSTRSCRADELPSAPWSTPRRSRRTRRCRCAGNKRVLRELLAAEGALDPDVERELVELREACFRSEDFYEGVRAFAEKRPPRWQGRYGRQRPAAAAIIVGCARRAARATLVAAAAVLPGTAAAQPADGAPAPPAAVPEIAWRQSEAIGVPWAGRLRRGVQLPAEGADWFTWDAVRKELPSRGWRRWGTDVLVRRALRIVAEYRVANPEAPRVGIGDLSRRHGGDFGPRFGGLGHMTHQNGLDIDLYYPRRDGLERRPFRPGQVDRRLAQDLVDRFAAAGADVVYVGPSLGPAGAPRRGRAARAPRRSPARAHPAAAALVGRAQADQLVAVAQHPEAGVVEAQQLAVADDRRRRGRRPACPRIVLPASSGPTIALDDVQPAAHGQQVLEHLDDLRAVRRPARAGAPPRPRRGSPSRRRSACSRWTVLRLAHGGHDRRALVVLARGERRQHGGVVAVGGDEDRRGRRGRPPPRARRGARRAPWMAAKPARVASSTASGSESTTTIGRAASRAR